MRQQPLPHSEPRASQRVAWIVLALACLLRGGVLLAQSERLKLDTDGYRALASNLVDHGVFGHGNVPTAYRPPLYPLLLVPCMLLGNWYPLGIGLLHWIFGIGTLVAVLWLALRWQLNKWAPLAVGLVACDPILVHQSPLVMTESLATLLAMLVLVALTLLFDRPTFHLAMLTGAGLGLASLCRPTFHVWTLAVAAALCFQLAWSSLRWKLAAAIVAGSLLVVSPWAVRNYLQFGQPVFTTTHGGYTLLLGNNPDYFAYLRTPYSEVWRSGALDKSVHEERLRGTGGEVENDRREYKRACESIRRDPKSFAYACLVRQQRFWGLVPRQIVNDETRTQTALRYAVGVWYLAQFILAVFGLLALGRVALRPGWLWGLLLLTSFSLVHAIYWSDLRMRAPLMPTVALLAAWGMARIRA